MIEDQKQFRKMQVIMKAGRGAYLLADSAVRRIAHAAFRISLTADDDNKAFAEFDSMLRDGPVRFCNDCRLGRDYFISSARKAHRTEQSAFFQMEGDSPAQNPLRMHLKFFAKNKRKNEWHLWLVFHINRHGEIAHVTSMGAKR